MATPAVRAVSAAADRAGGAGVPASRMNDFESLEFLGKGAFGSVHKVRNRIDGQLYALKKIRVSSDAQRREKVLREARLLSSLTHQRIVRYYQCWVETVEEDAEEARGSGSGDAPTVAAAAAPEPDAVTAAASPRLACNICKATYLDWGVSFSAWTALDASLQPLNLCTDCYKLALINMGFDLSRIAITYGPRGAEASPAPPPKRPTVTVTYLFIQTEFCERTLLEECVEIIRSTPADGHPGLPHAAVARIWALFWEVVEGLGYLHSASVVHRDLKPSNIFTLRGCVKIGDLGLATTITAAAALVPTGAEGGGSGPGGGGLGLAGGIGKAAGGGGGGGGPVSPRIAVPRPTGASSPGLSSRGPALGVVHEGGGEGEDEDEEEDGPTPEPGVAPGSLAGAGESSRGRAERRGGATGGVGTYFYMSPETLGVDTPAVYSAKSDLYALGVILFEMFSAARIERASAAARSAMLMALKRGAVPRSFLTAFPVAAQLIANLMQAEHTARPTTADLLRYRYFVWEPAMAQAGFPHIDTSATGRSLRGPAPSPSSRAPVSPRKASTFVHMSLPDMGGGREGEEDGKEEERTPQDEAAGGGEGGGAVWQSTADASTLRALLRQAMTTIGEQTTAIGQLKAQLAHTQAQVGSLRAHIQSGGGGGGGVGGQQRHTAIARGGSPGGGEGGMFVRAPPLAGGTSSPQASPRFSALQGPARLV